MIVRDPIHGDIELTTLQVELLDLPDVQRLRGIKQLGTAHLVYPGCLHTRFDHSLGACAAANRIISGLRRGGTAIPPDLADLIGAAALLHDVTHVPFGHTLEDERRLFPRHDKGTRLVRKLAGDLGEQLGRLGVFTAIAGLLGAEENHCPQWAAEVVSSTIDADLLDYLRRDSYFAGLEQAYDDRIFRLFTVCDGRLALHMAKHGMERPDARSEVIQVLRMRYFLTERVYYHHTKVTAGAMISKAVEMAVEQGLLIEPDLLKKNDWTLLDHLYRVGSPEIAKLVDRVQRRDLFKRGYVLSSRTADAEARTDLVRRFHHSAVERRSLEQELAAELGCDEGEVIVYCPAMTVMKEAAAPVLTPRGVELLNATDPGSETHALEQRYSALWRLYVFAPAESANDCARASTEAFGLPSEYVPRQ